MLPFTVIFGKKSKPEEHTPSVNAHIPPPQYEFRADAADCICIAKRVYVIVVLTNCSKIAADKLVWLFLRRELWTFLTQLTPQFAVARYNWTVVWSFVFHDTPWMKATLTKSNTKFTSTMGAHDIMVCRLRWYQQHCSTLKLSSGLRATRRKYSSLPILSLFMDIRNLKTASVLYGGRVSGVSGVPGQSIPRPRIYTGINRPSPDYTRG